VERNGRSFHVWLWGAGILIAASQDVEIAGNTLVENANGISLIQQNRGSGSRGPWIVQNVWVHDNHVRQYSGVVAGAAQDTGDSAIFTSRNNRFDRNSYEISGSGAAAGPYYAWANNNTLSAGGWRQYGLDVNGTWP
jgi:hypothetical protein